MLLYFFTILIALSPTIEGLAEPTKICANDDCSEKLFTAVATRDYPPTHEEFIKIKINDTITVYAIKFSNRPDIAEGVNGEGIRGKFYINYVEREAYFFFLSHVVNNNVIMSEVAQSSIPGVPKLVKKHPANPYLWRDYKVKAGELNEKVLVEMAEDPNEKKSHHHHHHHGHDHHHHHGHDHSHDSHDHSHDHKELTKTEEAKKDTVPNIIPNEQTAPPLVDPLKKMSLDAMKGIQKDIPKPETTVEQQQQLHNDIHNSISDTNNNINIDSNIVVEKAVELKEELHIASDMVNSIIDEIASPHHGDKFDSIHTLKHEEVKKDHIPISENIATPPPVAEMPTITLPPVPIHPVKTESQQHEVPVNSVPLKAEIPHHEVPINPDPLKAEIPRHEVPVTPIPSKVETPSHEVPINHAPLKVESAIHHDPVVTQTIPPASMEIPTLIPKTAKEPKIQTPPQVPTVAPIGDASTTPAPLAAEIPATTIATPAEFPATTQIPNEAATLPTKPVEIPTTTIPTPIDIPTPLPNHFDLPPTTTSASMEEPTTPLPLEVLPVTTTPIPKEEITTISPPEVFHELPHGPAASALQEEIRERRTLSEDAEYCYKNDCSGADINSTASPGFIATTIRPILKSFSASFRSFMPYPLSEFDDTGAFVFIFFIVSTFMYIISKLFSDSGRPDVLDRRALHDSLTKIKEQEVQIEQLKRNASDPAVTAQYGKEIERLRKEKSEIENRLHSMGQAIQQRESECHEAHQEQKRLQAENHQLIAEKAELQNKFDNVFTENQDLAKELALVRSQLAEANERQSNSVAENQESRKLINELESDLNELQSKNSSLQIELDTLNTKCEQLEKQNDNLKMSESGCMDLIRELEEKLKTSEAKIAKMFKMKKDGTDETGSGESNASNGWSDMDIGDLEVAEDIKEDETTTTETEATKPEKPAKPVKIVTLGKKDNKAAKEKKESSPEHQRKESVTEKARASSIDIYEVVNLKSELRKLEHEREDLKRELANEQRSREAVEQQLDQLKKTLIEKKSDLEQTAKDKDYFRTQTETLSQRVAEYTQKIERLQEDREKVFVLEKDILVLSKEKEEAYSKIKDLERAVRKAEEQSTKLETRYFHEERRLKEQMYKLEEQLTKAKISTIALENAGSGNSSDRGDFLLANRNNVDVPSLWSDLDGPETSFDDSPLEGKRESRRRSIREQQQQPMESGRRSVGRRENGQPSQHRPRYRSRSAGRQRQSGAPSPYLTGGVGLPPPPHSSSRASPTNYYEHSDRAAEIRRSTGRLSRSGQQLGYYSSDGSDPLSPPPQIASRSEMKPSVQLHKPAPKYNQRP